MDVNNSEYIHTLPAILKHIASSHFIAFDLELSGIPIYKNRNSGAAKQTLQERYAELKQAAEKYHILQLGITCVEQDSKNQSYELRSYNFNVSPLINDDLGLDRDFTYSTGAVDFLLAHGYDMAKPFRHGIPYLTRAETVVAEHRARSRLDRSAIPDIKLDANDQRAHRFVKHVHDQVTTWQKSLSPILSSTNDTLLVGGIPASAQEHAQPNLPLNAFERRLVHQIVRAQFPSLSTQSRGDYVQVLVKDEKDQKAYNDSLQRRLNDLLFRQIGLRWVTEAIVGGDLSGLFPAILGPKHKGSIRSDQGRTEIFEQAFRDTLAVVQNRRKVLVGHNCFIDFIYFYHTFIGTLPEDVNEFQDIIHSLFPLVIDTKYLATAGPGGMAYRSSPLSQIEESLTHMATPEIATPRDHPSYLNAEQYHEAGYDSYVTSKVLLRLVAKFQKNEIQGDSFATQDPITINRSKQDHDHPSTPRPKDTSAPVSTPENERVIHAWTSTGTSKSTKPSTPSTNPKPLHSSNRFASLTDDVNTNGSDADDSAETMAQHSPAKPDNKSPTTILMRRSNSDKPEVPSNQVKTGDLNKILIPDWDSEFWITYGNKLRVYGTVEEEMDLDPNKSSEEERSSLGRRPSLLASLLEKWKSFIF